MKMEKVNLFSTLDYVLFCGMLILSAIIGIYFGFFGKKQDSPKEYLHGGKNMKIFPIAASLVASDISALTLLAVPTDIYLNGSAYSMIMISTILMTFLMIYINLPVFYNLQITSSYEYLKLRFSSRVCKMASFIFSFISSACLPVIIYIPALAFHQVSGVQLNIIIPIVCIICIFYTTFGGIKAVVWTDTLQMLIMVGSLLIVIFMGISVEGGFGRIIEKSYEGGRLHYNFSPDPTDKTSCITALVGFLVMHGAFGSNPVFTQRFMALPTFKDAKITAVLFCIGAVFFKLVSWFLGLIIFAHYKDCSPVAAGYIEKPDQILPYYIMEVSSILPGLPGIFIAGLFCAALSTISSSLNTMAGTLYEDFIKEKMAENTSDKRASDIMKLIVVLLGLLFIALVFIVQYLGEIFQLAMTLSGIVVGPLLALFTLGLFLPFVNEKGMFYGSLGGLIFVCWIMSGATYYKLTGQIIETNLPLSTDGCDILQNITTTIQSTKNTSTPFFLYRISFYYYALLGFLSTSVIAISLSLFTGGLQQTIRKDLLTHVIHPFLSRNSTKYTNTFDNPKELQQLNEKQKLSQLT